MASSPSAPLFAKKGAATPAPTSAEVAEANVAVPFVRAPAEYGGSGKAAVPSLDDDTGPEAASMLGLRLRQRSDPEPDRDEAAVIDFERPRAARELVPLISRGAGTSVAVIGHAAGPRRKRFGRPAAQSALAVVAAAAIAASLWLRSDGPVGENVTPAPPEARISMPDVANADVAAGHETPVVRQAVDSQPSMIDAAVSETPDPKRESVPSVDPPIQAYGWAPPMATGSLADSPVTTGSPDTSRLPTDSTAPPQGKAVPPPELRSVDAPVPGRRPRGLAGGAYAIQLASLDSMADAERAARTLQRRHGEVLSGRELRIEPAVVAGHGQVFRLRIEDLESARAASRLCARLAARRAPCLVIRQR